MNIFQAISMVLATSCAFLGIIILIKNRISFVNLLFIISCLCGVLTVIVYTFIWWNPDRQSMIFFNTINIIIVMLNFSLILHFLIEFTNFKLRLIIKILLYVPACVISVATVFSKTAFSRFVWNNGHWIAFPPYYGIWGLVFLMFFYILYPFFDIIILSKWIKNSRFKRDRIQGKIILFSLLSLFAGSFFTDFVIHLFGISLFPIGPLVGVFYLCGIFFCLAKYQFLTFDISSISNEIITRMDDFVIIINPDGLIIMTNDVFKNRISRKNKIYYNEVIVESELMHDDIIKRLFEGKADNLKAKLFFKKGGEKIYSEAFLSRISNKTGDFTGILIISKELTGAKQFKKKYKITDRQFEIIDLTICGLSNRDISEKLNLTRRTVETHFSNIYSKLSINNKMELLQLCKEFNII